MTELIYEEDYEFTRGWLVEIVEHIEAQEDPIAACKDHTFEASLTEKDLQRIIRWRRQFPHWVEEKRVPPMLVQKAMLRDGHYGEEAQIRALQVDAMSLDRRLELLRDWMYSSDG